MSFPLVEDPEGAALVAWTTTPWTLPSNLALCVHPEFTYVKVGGWLTGLLGMSGEGFCLWRGRGGAAAACTGTTKARWLYRGVPIPFMAEPLAASAVLPEWTSSSVSWPESIHAALQLQAGVPALGVMRSVESPCWRECARVCGATHMVVGGGGAALADDENDRAKSEP